MCNFEEFMFVCGHSVKRLKSYCHQARVDPLHQCFFVKRLTHIWDQGRLCENCERLHWEMVDAMDHRHRQQQQQEEGYEQGEQHGGGSSGGGPTKKSKGKGKGRAH